MALPASGPISLRDVNAELDYDLNFELGLGDSAVRTLFDVSAGAISLNNGYGKQNRVGLTVVYSSSGTQVSTNVSTISGYVAGKSDIVITVNSGVVFTSSALNVAAWTITGGTAGDTITVNNSGLIYGAGGSGGFGGATGVTEESGNTDGPGYGGDNPDNPAGSNGAEITGNDGTAGTLAIYADVGCAVTFNNAGSVLGGGGGAGGDGGNNRGGGSAGNGGPALTKASNFTFVLNSTGDTFADGRYVAIFAGGGGGGSGWGNRSAGSTAGGAPGQAGFITSNGGGNFGAQGSAGAVSNFNGTKIYSGPGSWNI
jgi:hypothetical protein